MADVTMTLPDFAGVMYLGQRPLNARHPRERPSSPRKRGATDRDVATHRGVAGVNDGRSTIINPID